MNITKLALEKSRVTLVAVLIIIIGGIFSYLGLPRDEDPGFIIRVATVITNFPGASPERVEELVTDKIENVVQEMPELDYVASNSKTGISIIYVAIRDEYTDMQPIWDKLRRKVDKVQSELPEEAYESVVNDEFGDVYGTIVTLTGEGFSYAELKDIADDVRDEILNISNVSKVEIYGDQEEQIFIDYSNSKLSEFGLSPQQLKQMLEARNIIIPGGEVRFDQERLILEPSGNFESIEDINKTIIEQPDTNEIVYLGDVVDIYRGYVDPPAEMIHYNGKKGLALAISMKENGNIIDMGSEVNKLITRVEKLYPLGIDFDVVVFQPEIVDKKVNEFINNLFQSVIAVVFVMMISMGLRTGVLVASLIPISMLMALMIMRYLGIGLDQMSLSSLIIALGMLVDNAIVMSESIMVHLKDGKKAIDAAVLSSKELLVPLLTSTLTTACAFLPIYLAESATGEYTAPIFKVVTITLLCSWILSLTMIPLFCAKFMKIKSEIKSSYDNRYYDIYRKFLITVLKNPYKTVIVTVVVFILAMNGFKYIPNQFFPSSDRTMFTIETTLPSGTAIEKTSEVVSEIENYLKKEYQTNDKRKEGIIDWVSFIGEGSPRFVLSYNPETSSPEFGMFILNTTSNQIIEGIAEKIRLFCFENYPDLIAEVEPLSSGPSYEAPIEVRISGKNQDVLFSIVDEVKEKLETIKGVRNIRDNWGNRTKKLLVSIDSARAHRAGITNQDIALSLKAALSGYETTDFREGDKTIPIVLRTSQKHRDDLGKLESINVYSQSSGQSVPLKQVANITPVWNPPKILRRGGLKTVTVQASLETDMTATEVNNQITPWLKEKSNNWGIGYKWELGGENEKSSSANQSIIDKIPIALLAIVLILIIQFNSIRKTTIILLTIPLGLIG
ncbi:MAG: efflux RND transporter permease subunit, partial [Cyanobacteriota bacterium]